MVSTWWSPNSGHVTLYVQGLLVLKEDTREITSQNVEGKNANFVWFYRALRDKCGGFKLGNKIYNIV